jgi:hypothetical protein
MKKGGYMARINVFLEEDLLNRINKRAGPKKRSAFIQKAVVEYFNKLEEDERRKKMEKASRQIDQLALRFGDWDPASLIRKFRDQQKGRA